MCWHCNAFHFVCKENKIFSLFNLLNLKFLFTSNYIEISLIFLSTNILHKGKKKLYFKNIDKFSLFEDNKPIYKTLFWEY